MRRLFSSAAAGIGHITIIDDDMVWRTDLNRQIIYREEDVGRAKAQLAAQAAQAINPDIQISHLVTRLTKGNVKNLVTTHDVVVDCSDNAATRYLLGDLPITMNAHWCLAGRCEWKVNWRCFKAGMPAPPVIAVYSRPCLMPNRRRDALKRAFWARYW